MATITSAQSGDWNTASTWTGGVVPTSEDDVQIGHAVTVAANFQANTITVGATGSLTVSDSWNQSTSITGTFGKIEMVRVLNDNRTINLDGVSFARDVVPALSSLNGGDAFPDTPTLTDGSNVLIDDPGFLSRSAILRDMKPEGCPMAYAEKVSNAVRYMTAIIHVKSDKLQYLGSMYRMAKGPHQVLLVTHSCLIKGFIETMVPDPQSIGKEYISVKVTVAEGPSA